MAKFDIAVDQPVETLPAEDPTSVEFMSPDMLTIRQVDEDGEVHTLCLPAAAAIALAKLINAHIVLPGHYTHDSLNGR